VLVLVVVNLFQNLGPLDVVERDELVHEKFELLLSVGIGGQEISGPSLEGARVFSCFKVGFEGNLRGKGARLGLSMRESSLGEANNARVTPARAHRAPITKPTCDSARSLRNLDNHLNALLSVEMQEIIMAMPAVRAVADKLLGSKTSSTIWIMRLLMSLSTVSLKERAWKRVEGIQYKDL